MNLDKFEYYFKLKIQNVDYSEIRHQMKAEGMSEAEISKMIKEIDAEVLLYEEQKNRPRINGKVFVGSVIVGLSLLGLVLLFLIGVRGGLIIIALLGTTLSGIALIAQHRTKQGNRFENRKWRK